MSVRALRLRFRVETHAVFDLGVVVLLALLPTLFGFEGANAATVFCWGGAAAGLMVYVLTRYPQGLSRWIPMRWHRRLDYAAALVLIAVPPLAFGDVAGLPVAGPVLGLLSMTVNALTDYRSDESAAG